MTNPPEADRTRWHWTWALALIGGNVAGFMGVWQALYPALMHRPFLYGSASRGPLSVIGILLASIVLPITVASLAPRRSFLWAAATSGIALAWSVTDRVAALNGPGLIHDLWENGAVDAFILLVICGPISLIRLLLRHGREGAGPPGGGVPGVDAAGT